MNRPGRSLLWQTFLLLAVLMLASVLAWTSLYAYFQREPQARQSAQMVVAVVNLSRSALIAADPTHRRELLTDWAQREGIQVYVADPSDQLVPFPARGHLSQVQTHVRHALGASTRFAAARNAVPGFWVSFFIDDDEFWVRLPRERVERDRTLGWLGWGAAASLLALLGAYLIVRRVTLPLKRLAQAARQLGQGIQPPPLAESGPGEIAHVIRSFNLMSHDLATLESDRALVLAGISHDLRTPLARLRLATELADMPPDLRAGIDADIEEMDRTIGQFLEFARPLATQAEPTDPGPVLEEFIAACRGRGQQLTVDIGPLAPVGLSAEGLRRALGNLVDNAFRYGTGDGTAPAQVHLNAVCRDGQLVIEVRDRGPGVPGDQLERIKRPFIRLNEARTSSGGTGLGLAIVERIVRQAGGVLTLENIANGGLVARITLPRRDSQHRIRYPTRPQRRGRR